MCDAGLCILKDKSTPCKVYYDSLPTLEIVLDGKKFIIPPQVYAFDGNGCYLLIGDASKDPNYQIREGTSLALGVPFF
jgi:hypothetical protein